ncbi:hypothetical protein SAMN06295974_3841 [Plantibacter flavus]|uniref:Uncharacterized protein n=1 Tax=Plantibacter flavus TaxID=150123 RepID=A0A3N2BL53_9MICO|nr:hypothetical protein [Plantibacter flavus]ROR76013.1 hypothetical protein EDD42_3965 [Plantibacter flavus]SMG49292.1 hypothetical protein SAMN06295974_3841 [Plantibacter flavus]
MPDTSATAVLEEPPIETADDFDDKIVHVIESRYHYRDDDNYPVVKDEIQVDEGWFSTPESAQARCDYLNTRHIAGYNASVDAARRAHEAKIQRAELANQEAAVIRAAGLNKADVRVPPPFVAESLASFRSGTSYTVYEVVEIKHSDHDGLARAAGVVFPPKE